MKTLKELYYLLSKKQKKEFLKLQVLVVMMALVEVAGVVSIGPFMALVGDFELLERGGVLTSLYLFVNSSSQVAFITLVGIIVLTVLAIGSVLSVYTTWKVSLFGSKTGIDLGNRLFNYYMNQTWLYHTTENSSKLSKNIALETTRVTDTIIQPIMQLNARIVTAIFISVGLIIYNPVIAIVGLIIFTVSYYILYKLVKSKLLYNGQAISDLTSNRFKLMNEGFGGIKEILLLNKQNYFTSKFEYAGDLLAYSHGTNKALAETPRFFMEFIAFGSLIALILYLLNSYEGDLSLILQTLSIYALASFKLLPAFQQMYRSVSTLNGNISAFNTIREDLHNSVKKKAYVSEHNTCNFTFKKNIIFDNICFSYPKKKTNVLNNLNIKIDVNKTIGFVGSTGSGKSTIIDMLVGLINPSSGSISIDNITLDNQIMKQWQNEIGFVSQSIFISDTTIVENIAFGIDKEFIDIEQINKVVKLSYLDELISQLEKGIYTTIGERGVQLSGGQKQRIGIARALYHDAEILVFDEATSALDGITEKMIMDAIDEFSGKKTIIIIAHRIATLKNCDNIIMLEEGKVVDEGTYSELLNNNKKFKNMANI